MIRMRLYALNWTKYKNFFTYEFLKIASFEINISIDSPQENKTLTRFVSN